jgi:membrane-associated phospholipid phosphatase
VSLLEVDCAALVFARTRGHRRWAERAVAAFSRTGEHGACWLALGITRALLAGQPGAGVGSGTREAWLRGVRVVAGAYGLNYLVKLAVRRPRPELRGLPPLSPTVSRLSFPSAHATTSFAAARAYRALASAWALYAVAGTFALSRPYLGVHYPSDALAGALLGTFIAEAWLRSCG